MPRQIDPKKTKLSVEVGETLKLRLLNACKKSKTNGASKTASDIVRDALLRWLDSEDRKSRRHKAAELNAKTIKKKSTK